MPYIFRIGGDDILFFLFVYGIKMGLLNIGPEAKDGRGIFRLLTFLISKPGDLFQLPYFFRIIGGDVLLFFLADGKKMGLLGIGPKTIHSGLVCNAIV